MSEVVRVSSAELFEIEPDERLTFEGDIGVPERHVRKIGQLLLRFVQEELGRSPDSVMFSGYTQSGAHEKLPQPELGIEDSFDFFDDEPVVGSQDPSYDELDGLLEKIDKETNYCFSTAAELNNSREAMDNPIHFAGIDEDSIIGIYDLDRLQALHEDEFFVPASKEDIEATKLAELHPRFVVREPEQE